MCIRDSHQSESHLFHGRNMTLSTCLVPNFSFLLNKVLVRIIIASFDFVFHFAISGHVLAFYNLAVMHASGTGVLRSCNTATEVSNAAKVT